MDDVHEEDYDLDWFAVDEMGNIGHFATLGVGALPTKLRCRLDELELVREYFLSQPKATSNVAIADRAIRRGQVDANDSSRIEWFLRDFRYFAERGAFSFNSFLDAHRPTGYYLVAIPESPVRRIDLPPSIWDIISLVRFPLIFAEVDVIDAELVASVE